MSMDPEELREGLFAVLRRNGAVLAGVADLRGTEAAEGSLVTGVSVAAALPAGIVRGIRGGPTPEYSRAYHELNAQLDAIVRAGSAFLAANGYASRAVTVGSVHFMDSATADFAHKTVAVRAGLGWIGKSSLLVTPDFGGAVRISTILTSAPLPPDDPVTESRCGSCSACSKACPGHAIKNAIWKPGAARSELFDTGKCLETMLDVTERSYGAREDICGRCFAVCPYTLRYVGRELGKDPEDRSPGPA